MNENSKIWHKNPHCRFQEKNQNFVEFPDANGPGETMEECLDDLRAAVRARGDRLSAGKSDEIVGTWGTT